MTNSVKNKKSDNQDSKPKNVRPIKDAKILNDVQDTLLHNFKFGIRNYTMWRVGLTTLLRVSDLVKLRMSDVFKENGTVKESTKIVDKKTGKSHEIFLNNVANDLRAYKDWRIDHDVNSEWLFPTSWTKAKQGSHIAEKGFYRVMQKVGSLLDVDYLGTHTMRKTGAYMVYKRTGNIGLVMKLLNHSSESATLHYIGIDRETQMNVLNSMDFNSFN